jgi:hypothetical protein
LIWIGILLGWKWIRNPWFRYTHMFMILIVAAEATIGMTCPLTDWENDLLRWQVLRYAIGPLSAGFCTHHVLRLSRYPSGIFLCVRRFWSGGLARSSYGRRDH